MSLKFRMIKVMVMVMIRARVRVRVYLALSYRSLKCRGDTNPVIASTAAPLDKKTTAGSSCRRPP